MLKIITKRNTTVVRRANRRPYANRGWWFPGALMPDLTTAQGARWWTSWRRYLVADVGVDGFKTDGGEHAWGRDLRFGDGSAGEESYYDGENLFRSIKIHGDFSHMRAQ